MFKAIRQSFARKAARRITREYPVSVDRFIIDNMGEVEFANWQNPLAEFVKLNTKMPAFFKQFITEGDLVIDIGANTGDTTIPMALCAGTSGLTLAFDPNPYVFKVLKENAALNKGKVNIVPVNSAITTEDDEFYFISSEASFSNGGISKTKESIHGKFVCDEKIKGLNLKKFLESNYNEILRRLSFVKIDTEGYDKEILKSIASLIKEYKPVIVAESMKRLTNEEKMELYDVIVVHGYDIYYFEDFDVDAPVERLNNRKDITKWKQTINIYALPRK